MDSRSKQCKTTTWPSKDATFPNGRQKQAKDRRGGDQAAVRRQSIIEALEARPGLSFRQLMRALDIPSGSLRHHLYRLERLGRVWVEPLRSVHLFFAGERPCKEEAQRLIVRALMDDVDHEVARVAVEAPSQSVILDVFEGRMPRSTVQNRLARLERLGALVAVSGGGIVVYEPGVAL